MKVVVRSADASKGCQLLENYPIPSPPPEHVQIKVMASPVNPCDESFCVGRYAPHGKKEPFACGYEGSGIVTALGAGVPSELLNRRVAFYRAIKYTEDSFGVWAHYAILHYTTCIILDDNMSFEETCGLCINPLTIFGFLEIMAQHGHKAIIHTAAASALGKMLLGICQKQGYELICIVRRKEQVQMLEALGAKHVLDQTEPIFEKRLAELATALDCHIAFDAVGGDLTAKLLKALPNKSTVCMYGSLGGEFKGLLPSHFMASEKQLTGLVLSSTAVIKEYSKFKEAAQLILQDIREGRDTFKTKVFKRYTLEDFQKALSEYKGFASEGKAIICPNYPSSS